MPNSIRDPSRLLAVLLLAGLAFCVRAAPVVADDRARPGEAGNVLRPVTLQLKWTHQFQFAGYYAAIKQGYYRRRGLQVNLVEAMPGDEPMRQVAAGKAEFGVGTTDLLLMRAAGAPVVVLAVIFQHSPLALMVDKAKAWRNIHDLARGKLMIEPHSAELFAYLRAEGLSSSDIRLVEHTFSVDSLLQGKVDGMSVYSTDEPFLFREAGSRFHLFRPIEGGIDFYGDNLFTTEAMIRDRPDLVRDFVEASLEGWHYAMAHREEMVDYIIETYKPKKSRDHLLFEANEMAHLILSDIVRVGFINPARWERIAANYANLGMLVKDVDLEGFIYSSWREPRTPVWLVRALVAVAAALVLATAVAFWYARFNRRLRAEITERRSAEHALAERTSQLEDSNAQKDVLLSIIGHDIRNIFGPLLTYAELLAEAPGDMDQRTVKRYGASIREAGNAALTVLENLLDWASLKTGRQRVRPEDTNLAPLVAEVAQLFRATAERKQIRIGLAAIEPANVHIDPRMVGTVLRNLIHNALKFTDRGGSVSLTLRRHGGIAEISVADSGQGMPAEKIEQALSGDHTVSDDGTEGEQGTGLGLALSRQMVALNGGTLAIDSRPGDGTTVTVSFPLNT